MSAKNLEVEFSSLKNQVTDLILKIDSLVDKYVALEKKYEKCVSKKKKANFRCHDCGEDFETVKELQNHKKEHNSDLGYFQCDECDKCFKEESQLEEHVSKKHKKHECDDCDKVFDYEGTLEKHKGAAHENIVIFCHFYNNNKECPFDDQCVFVHEESEKCKYDKACERKLCMYRHEERIGDDADGDDDESVEDESYIQCYYNHK